eukprot:COSAG01_NODE_68073_length_265_cov_0.620482_2_plen_42_part_01
MVNTDQVSEAKAEYEVILPRMVANFGAADRSVLRTQGNFAVL